MTLRETALNEYGNSIRASVQMESVRQAELRENLRRKLWEILTLEVDSDEIVFDSLISAVTYKIDDLWFMLIAGEPLFNSRLGWVANCTQCMSLVIFPITSMVSLGQGIDLKEQRLLFCPSCKAIQDRALAALNPVEDAPVPTNPAQNLFEALRDFVIEYGMTGKEIPAIVTEEDTSDGTLPVP